MSNVKRGPVFRLKIEIKRRALVLVRSPSSSRRVLPDYLVIGAQRAGTTFLYSLLADHPYVVPPATKEVHWFDLNFWRPTSWYRAHFPLLSELYHATDRPEVRAITGEASSYYCFHPAVPERVARTLPHAKIIMLVRNPTERAISQYYHSVEHGFERLSLTDALAAEPERLAGQEDRLVSPRTRSLAHDRFSYMARGCYLDQLGRWRRWIPEERLLVMPSRDLFLDPQAAFDRICAFLGIPGHRLTELPPRNAVKRGTVAPADRAYLDRHFADHNTAFLAETGIDLTLPERA
jgi:hypothetical protein